MTQTLDRFRLLRTCFPEKFQATTSKLFFGGFRLFFLLYLVVVNAHGNLYDMNVCLRTSFFACFLPMFSVFTANFCLRYATRPEKGSQDNRFTIDTVTIESRLRDNVSYSA